MGVSGYISPRGGISCTTPHIAMQQLT